MRRLILLSSSLLLLFLILGCSSSDEPYVPPLPTDPPDPPDEEVQQPGTTYWWNDQVFYEVFVRSFMDDTGDGHGDLAGLIDKLDYLNDGDPNTDTDLGVTALWLMPVVASPSDHGYDATDYRTIQPQYGTNAQFQQLMSEAHARGIKVIVDYVMNHLSNEHEWFTAAADNDPDYEDWFLWRSSNPGWEQPWGGGSVWHRLSSDRYYYGVFWSGMPDLNYTNPDVEAEMLDIADFWLQTMGVDGFRLDAVKYLIEDGSTLQDTPETLEFWGRFRAHLNITAPDAFAVGEAWDDTDVVIPYVEAGLHTCFEFNLAQAIITAVNSGSSSSLASKVDQIIKGYPYHQYATFLTNHDQRRVLSQVGNTSRNKMAAAIMLTLPGVPFLFYGEEVGMQSGWDHHDVRRPMQWTAGANAGFTSGNPWNDVGDNYQTNNVETLQADDASLWNTYRRLVQARVGSDALRRGTYHKLGSNSSRLYAFLRHGTDAAVVPIHNLGTTTLEVVLSANASQLEPGEYAAHDLLTGATLTGLTVEEDGAFLDWRPVSSLAALGSVLVALEPVEP